MIAEFLKPIFQRMSKVVCIAVIAARILKVNPIRNPLFTD